MPISNDTEFKAALASLSGRERRRATAALVRLALDLSPDPRVRSGLDLALRADADSAEFATAATAVNSARVASYTQCGHNADWSCQAGHFVARATQQCLHPEISLADAWDALMQARMARICQAIGLGEGTSDREAEAQYRALAAHLETMKGTS